MKSLILFCSLIWATVAFSQNEASNWYFGYGAGLVFDSAQGTVSSVDNGRLSTNEGCTSISDTNGRLLFYTDGKTVYNSAHEIMQNGTGLFGDASSSQSAIIAPKPGDDNLYYVFTVDNSLDNSNYGLNYSVVDISLNNNLGRIVQKNVNLLQLCTEKITVVQKNCITGSLWLVTLAAENGIDDTFNTYHAFEINEEGINSNSVKSTFALGPNGSGVHDLRGYLVLSPDGSKLTSANMGDGLYIYDFDALTGVASNQMKLGLDDRANRPYGIAYSPNNRFLYVHSSNDYFSRSGSNDDNNPENHFSVLTQFDLSNNDIQESAIVIDAQNLYRGALQLGPNGKIYRALSATYANGIPYLGVINRPNELGQASNYIHNAVNLAPNQSAQGLPPFIQSLFNTDIDIIQNGNDSTTLNLCQGETYTLTADQIPNASYVWSFNGVELPENSNVLEISNAGHYSLYLDPKNGGCPLEGDAYVIYQNLPETIDYELVQCDIDENEDGLTDFNLEEAVPPITAGNESYEVSFHRSRNEAENGSNPITPSHYRNTTNPQSLYIRALDPESGCLNVTQLTLRGSIVEIQETTIEVCDDDGINDGFYEFDLDTADIDTRPDTHEDLNIQYYRTTEDALLEINALAPNYITSTEDLQRIYARFENSDSCLGITSITLIVNKLPEIETEGEILYCLNLYPQTITLNAGLGNKNSTLFTYEWSTGQTSPEIEVNDIGNFTVTVTNREGCKSLRNITVLPSNIATITNIEVKDASANNTIIVSVSGEGNYEYALDQLQFFQADNTFLDVKPGLHTVFVRDRNECGTVQQQVSVIGFPKFFSPNGDGFNDTWQIEGINEDFQANTIIYIYDRYGKLLKELLPTSTGWDGTFNNQSLPATDYWFSVQLEDGRIFNAHFSLRN